MAEAIALCNRRIEVVGTDLYKVTQEVTDAVDLMVASKNLGGGTMEDLLGREKERVLSRRRGIGPGARGWGEWREHTSSARGSTTYLRTRCRLSCFFFHSRGGSYRKSNGRKSV